MRHQKYLILRKTKDLILTRTRKTVEDEEVNNNNDFFNESDDNKYDTPYVRHSNIVRHRPTNLIPNMAGGLVPGEECSVYFQVEDMRKITMEVEKMNTVDDVIHACVLRLSLKTGLKKFWKKEEEEAQK